VIQPIGIATPSQLAVAERPVVRPRAHERQTCGQGRDMDSAAPRQPRAGVSMIRFRVDDRVTCPIDGTPHPADGFHP